MTLAIAARNVTIGYGHGNVIKSANFEIEKQDFVCIVGTNGAGKSTLIKAMLGLMRPKSGKILFGEGVNHRAIGYLPQEKNAAPNFPATVIEVVLSGALGRLGARAFYRKQDVGEAERALKRLGILALKDAGFSDFSGGQKQKVLLARALVATSEVLILDEPSNNLDPKSRKEFYEILKELNQSGLTIIMITHDLDAEDLIGNKIISISESKVECLPTEEYLRRFK